MTEAILALSADACLTVQAAALVSTVDGELATEVPAPLGNRISLPGVQKSIAQQLATSVQLAAAVLAIRYPWLKFDGLYRFIIANDRGAVIDANSHHLKRLRFNIASLKSRTGAFAFPTGHGIVVVMPAHVLAYAFAPTSETERQYGLTTIWHELAHVHDLALHYLGHGKQGLASESAFRLDTREVWHEYFADRHSHWPGFAVDFELDLVEGALNDFACSKSAVHAQTLAVRLGSAHGRLGAEGVSIDDAGIDVLAKLDSLGVGHQWNVCAVALDEALEEMTRTGCAPALLGLEAALQAFQTGLMMSL